MPEGLSVYGVGTVLASLEDYRIKKTAQVRIEVAGAAADALEVAIELTPVSADGSHGMPPGTLRDGNAIQRAEGLETLEVWELYNNVFYAGYVCMGTYKMAARDFMTPAFVIGRQRLYERLLAISVI